MVSIVNGTDEKAKRGLRKYIDYLKQMVIKIRDFLKGESSTELDEITRLRDMFESAFAKAVANKKALESGTKS